MSHNWKQWVGQVVNGQFPLLEDLGCSEDSAVFLTERHEGERLLRAAIKLIPAIPENSELQLSRWRLAAGLSHPHLIQLFELGRCELGKVPLLYVVMEYAEENLAQVLSDRALTPDETRAMLEPLVDVLAYLHGKGFVHGHIKPANIMAHGDQLKLSSDALCRAGESSGPPGTLDAGDRPESARGFIPVAKPISPAGDVWSLGMTLVEALTQHLPVQQVAGQRDPLLPQALPEPFLDIARHCLLRNPASRWTVAEIAARLADRTPIPQARTLVQPAKPAARLQGTHAKRHRYAVPIAAGVVLAAILAGPRLFRRHAEAPQVPAAALQEPAIQPKPKPQAPPEARPATVARPNAPEKTQDSGGITPLPVPVGLETPNVEEAKAGAQPPAALSVEGAVLQQVLPDVPQSARDTIHGTVRVTVSVDVDPSGNVEAAELETPGPSKYFAQLALEAAQRWRFNPPKIAGRSILSTWTLRFHFTRAETTVVPSQEIP